MVSSLEIMQNVSHSVNPYFFSKNLRIKHLSKAAILDKLSLLFGLVYLENASHPIIAFLPQHYFVVNGKNSAFYSRNEDRSYTQNSSIQTYNEFLTFKSESKSGSATSFHGGYIGFVDYNHASQQSLKETSLPLGSAQPQFFIGQYNSFIEFTADEWCFRSHEQDGEAIFRLISSLLTPNISNTSNTEKFYLKSPCQARWDKFAYQHAFQKVQNYIVAGDCYQINLTQEFTAQASGQLLDTAEKFWELTNAPYAGYLKLDHFEILSCSPELFIDFKDNRTIVTKPIKGTMPRFTDPQLDEQSKQSLIHSEKDRAENVMIVDLLRNDLSVYAETGSVKTTKLFDIESFNQVHHMVSEIQATLKPDANPFKVLMSALPGGSITGAPKIRAMEIIEELEGAPRGAYCGSLGYFNYDGTGSWNILIRTIQKFEDKVSIWAGGGITIASDCDAEYQECFDKVSAMLDLLNTWHQPS